ncbi:MAG: FIST C-terminal domain-containing protein [Defluviitaleaceae bacterium]|nr:FIST C-terminal domain-containing protein [Defluviitaleaceae bacterium]MCL2239188.1 FIST C-terminal domain-containing protein [Defluviitaleaceae bacterium]
MVEMFTARTSEVDTFDEAIAEIESQIDFSSLKKYSGGIIFCCMEFLESGMVQALCETLPFDVIGMTSMGTADLQGYGFFDLTLTVLTSDEVRFKAGMVHDINSSNHRDKIEELYKGISADGEPSLIFVFMPFVKDVAGYELLDAADKACNGAELWGALPTSIDVIQSRLGVMCNGVAHESSMAMLSLCGPVTPRYVVANLPENIISNTRGIITKSDGAVLMEVNDMSAMEYFKHLNVEVTTENLRATPLLIYREGTQKPVALAIFEVTEDGAFLMGGEIPQGAAVSVGGIDATTIIESCREGLAELLAMENRNATVILPCVSRGVMMIPDQEGEMRLIYETLKESGLPYAMGYSGGEACPMKDAEGKMHNRFHNYTFCACVL